MDTTEIAPPPGFELEHPPLPDGFELEGESPLLKGVSGTLPWQQTTPEGENRLMAGLDIGKQAGNLALVVPNTIAAGLGGLAKAATTGDLSQGADVARQWQEEQLFSPPQTNTGKSLADYVNYPFENIARSGEQARDAMPNHPILGAIADTGINALPWALGGLHGARGAHAPVEVAPEHGTPTAPTAMELAASEHITAGQPDPVAAQASQGTASLMDAVKQADAQVQPPPVPQPVIPAAPPVQEGRGAPIPPPPPALAAKLQEMTGGDPAKIGSIIQQATAGKLKPGETPANLADAVTPISGKPRFTAAQVARGEHLQPEAPNEPANAPEVRGNIGGDRTGVDSAPEPATPGPAVEAPAASPAVEAVPPGPVGVGENLIRDSENRNRPPAADSVAAPFLPEERHAQRLDKHLTRLGDITPEQRQAVIENHGEVERDKVMNLPERRDLVPTIEAAQASGEPAAYGEIDVRGLGGLNAHMGSNSKADPHLRAVADIVNQHLQDAADESGGQVVLTRKGGDELGAIVKGMDPATLETALGKAKEAVAKYAQENGLDSFKGKEGAEPGLGLHYGVAEITKERSIGDTISAADSLVEARKKGAPYEQRGTNAEAGAVPPVERPGGSPAESVAGKTRGTGSETPATEGRAPAAETGEVAVADEAPGSDNSLSTRRTEQSAARTEPVRIGDGELADTETGVHDNPRPVPGQTEVSARNAAIDADRLARDLPEIPEAERQEWSTPHAEALAKIDADANWPKRLAAEVAKTPRPISATETMGLIHDLRALTAEHSAATKEVLSAREAGDTIAEAQAVLRQREAAAALTRNHDALDNGGREAARALSIRNAIVKDDYSITRNMERTKAAHGDYFDKETKASVEHLSEKIKKQDEIIERLQAQAEKAARPKSPKTADERMQEKLQKQIDEKNAMIQARLTACPI